MYLKNEEGIIHIRIIPSVVIIELVAAFINPDQFFKLIFSTLTFLSVETPIRL